LGKTLSRLRRRERTNSRLTTDASEDAEDFRCTRQTLMRARIKNQMRSGNREKTEKNSWHPLQKNSLRMSRTPSNRKKLKTARKKSAEGEERGNTSRKPANQSLGPVGAFYRRTASGTERQKRNASRSQKERDKTEKKLSKAGTQ